MKTADRIAHFLLGHAVPILFLIIIAIAVPLSGFSPGYLIQEMVSRISRNSFLVISLLIPIMAGMGLNFGMVLGAMAGQIGLIFVKDWDVGGVQGLTLAMLLGAPLAVFLGWVCGEVLNRAKGREMVTGYILGFFVNGLYQLAVLYGMGKVIPILSESMVLSRGYGIRNSVNLDNIRQSLDGLVTVNVGGTAIPVATLLFIALLCLFVVWFRTTKLGQDMRAVGQDMAVAEAAGIPVARTRIISIMISTVLACFGQILFLQNIGTMNTYNSHDQAGMFAIASLLVGGATVARASIMNVFVGLVLFHLMFVVSPMAGQRLVGSAQLGEYFRVFVSYGIIAISLVLHAWKRMRDKERERTALRTGGVA